MSSLSQLVGYWMILVYKIIRLKFILSLWSAGGTVHFFGGSFGSRSIKPTGPSCTVSDLALNRQGGGQCYDMLRRYTTRKNMHTV